jgi:hypothetical protein
VNPFPNILSKVSIPITDAYIKVTIVFIIASDQKDNTILPIDPGNSLYFEEDEYGDLMPIISNVTDTYFEPDSVNDIMPIRTEYYFTDGIFDSDYAYKLTLSLVRGMHKIEFREIDQWQYKLDDGEWSYFPGPPRETTIPSTLPDTINYNFQKDMVLYVITL